jgi:hypothetical protein
VAGNKGFRGVVTVVVMFVFFAMVACHKGFRFFVFGVKGGCSYCGGFQFPLNGVVLVVFEL